VDNLLLLFSDFAFFGAGLFHGIFLVCASFMGICSVAADVIKAPVTPSCVLEVSATSRTGSRRSCLNSCVKQTLECILEARNVTLRTDISILYAICYPSLGDGCDIMRTLQATWLATGGAVDLLET
jgi:hypothetical protein